MKIRIIQAIALCTLNAATLCAADPAADQTVATVNEQRITAAQVQAATPAASRTSPDAVKATLEKLIDTALLLQAARKAGYTVPAEIIQGSVNTLVTNEFAGDRGKLIERLKAEGMSIEDYEAKRGDEILVSAMRQQIAKTAADPEARKKAVATWLSTARANAGIKYN